MRKDEKIDRFEKSFKYDVRVELLKLQVDYSEECACIALRVGCTNLRPGRCSQGTTYARVSSRRESTPMKISNMQSIPRFLTAA